MFFDDYDGQPGFFENVFSFVKNNKLSHAYLIETRNIKNKEEVITDFVRVLYSQYCESNNEDLCDIRDVINDGNYIEIKLDNNNSMIKKEQILSIQEKFMTKSWNDKNRIYVIYDADKLNKQSANSLLKFLEEPEEGIIGILTSDNRYRVLETIRSRCQILSLKNGDTDYKFDELELLYELVKLLEINKLNSIAYLPIVCQNEYYSKEKWIYIFKSLQYIYEQALRKKINSCCQTDLLEIIEIINRENEINTLLYKLDILSKQIEKLEFNLNINLMLDHFIINFTGGDINA